MPQITKYVLFLTIFLSLSDIAHANDEDYQFCSGLLPEYEITYTESHIDYNLNKRARHLKEEFDANEFTLGYFHSNLNVEKQGSFTTFRTPTKKCTDLTKLDLTLNFNPTIYITKEAQTFKCTFERTIRHEHKHYTIEKTAFMSLLEEIDIIVKKHFDDFNKTSNPNKNEEMDKRLNELMIEINSYLELQTKLQHAALDTEENYAIEALSCDDLENNMLDRLFHLDNQTI